jgi:hypothetical protein
METTEEAAIIKREANALIAESRSHAWASADTGLLKTICASLREGQSEVSSPNGYTSSGTNPS